MGVEERPAVGFSKMGTTQENHELMNYYDSKDTLKGYDMIVSISAETINAHFQHMWEKKLRNDLPDLRGPEYPRLTHFIAHQLWLFPPVLPDYDGATVIEEVKLKNQTLAPEPSTYIKAYIGPPKIEFHQNRQRIATITVEFLRETNPQYTEKDSILQYWEEGRLKRQVISGWKISWEVEITQEVIDDPNKDLLQPARSPTNHIVMEERTINEIHRHFVVHHHLTTTPTGPTTSTVASSNFTLAAIFCRITSSPQVAGSFKLIPPDGAPQVDSWARTAALAAMWMEFHKMAARFDQRLPTPQNPFVLGYILTQKVRSSIDLGTNDRPASMTPAYFVPQECYLSTTAVPGDLFTSGTLNFCILTGSPKPNAYKSPPFIDPKSNHLDKTFFSELSLYGGPSGKGAKRPSGHDGIMAFSKRVFYYNWLQESLLSKLLIQPELYGQIVDYPVGQNNGFGNKKTSRTWEGNNNQFSRWATDFEVRTSSTSGLKVEGEGSQVIEVKYSSDFQNFNQEQLRQSDLKRQLFIDIEVRTNLHITFRKRFSSHLMDGDIASNFWLRSRYKVGYTITPGLGGIWSIEKDPARTDLPVENTPIENLGIYKEGFEADELRNWDGSGCQLCVGQASEAFFKIDVHDIHVNWTGKQKAIERWFATYAANLGKVEVDLRAGVDKVVIMPVADVVEFHDLNANQGHVYSSIDFPFLTPQVTKLL